MEEQTIKKAKRKRTKRTPEPQTDRLLTLKEISEKTGIDTKALIKLVDSGELLGGQIGKMYRVKETVYERWLKEKFGE
jgi:excisionase family DNA binding protein